MRIATAESCTGGMVAVELTSVPGSSDVVAGGAVTYSDQLKIALLGVPEQLLARHGAVSAEVAEAMAAGARQRLGAEVAVAVTGIAGPGGGSDEKPVGLVHLHVASPWGGEGTRMQWPGGRADVRLCGRRLQRFTCCASISAPIRVTPALEVRPTGRLVLPRTFVRRKLDARWFAGKGVEEMERDQALEAAVSQIERQFGKGAIMKMGEAGHVDVDGMSTGALSLDLALGRGASPGPDGRDVRPRVLAARRRSVTTSWRRRSGRAAWRRSSTPSTRMDPTYARRIGVNIDELLVSQPDNGEQALEIAEMLIR